MICFTQKNFVARIADIFFGQASDIATILDFKRRGRLGRAERETKGEGTPQLPKILQIQHGSSAINPASLKN